MLLHLFQHALQHVVCIGFHQNIELAGLLARVPDFRVAHLVAHPLIRREDVQHFGEGQRIDDMSFQMNRLRRHCL
jgi:hypothetical protein